MTSTKSSPTLRPSSPSNEVVAAAGGSLDTVPAVVAIVEVAHSFALPAEDAQIGTVLLILLRRYTVEEIVRAARVMPFDEQLAEKLRFTRGLAVVDFARAIEQNKLAEVDSHARMKEIVMNVVFDNNGLGEDQLVQNVQANLQIAGFEGDDITMDWINNLLR